MTAPTDLDALEALLAEQSLILRSVPYTTPKDSARLRAIDAALVVAVPSLFAEIRRLREVEAAARKWLECGSFQPGDGSPRHMHRALRDAGLLPSDHECPVCPYDRAAGGAPDESGGR